MKRVLLSIMVLVSLAVFSQDTDQVAKEANQAFMAQQWSASADLYKKLTQAEPKNVAYWIRLGSSLRRAGDLPGAEAALKSASDGGAAQAMPMQFLYNMAALHAQTGKREEALSDIENLAKNGMPAASLVEKEPVFTAFANEPRFTKAVEEMKEQASPCKSK